MISLNDSQDILIKKNLQFEYSFCMQSIILVLDKIVNFHVFLLD